MTMNCFREPPLSPLIKNLAVWMSCALVFVFVTGCHPDEPTPSNRSALRTIQVRAFKVERETIPLEQELMGTVQSKTTARIEAQIRARIIDHHAIPGKEVQAGDLLFVLEDREIQASLDQAQATRDQAYQDFQRYSHLLEQKAVTPAQFDEIKKRFEVAEAAQAQAEIQLSYVHVNAPFDGVVRRRLADVGDLAAPGKVLLELEDPVRLHFQTHVPESLIHAIHPGEVYPVRIGPDEILLHGEISEIEPSADPNSRTFAVKLDLPQSRPALRAGTFGRITLREGTRPALLVPQTALVERGQLEMIFVTQDGKARMRLVKSGQKKGDSVELLSGVQDGETVIVENTDLLRDGQPVEVQ